MCIFVLRLVLRHFMVCVFLEEVHVAGFEISQPSVCDVCTCGIQESRHYYVNCIDQDLDAIPADLPSKVTILCLNKNNVKDIPNNIFRNLRRLKILELEFNSINQLEVNSFYGLYELQKLSLKCNLLNSSHFPHGLFDRMPHLKFLDLSGNRISYNTIDGSLQELQDLEHLKIQAATNTSLGDSLI